MDGRRHFSCYYSNSVQKAEVILGKQKWGHYLVVLILVLLNNKWEKLVVGHMIGHEMF